MVKLEIIIDSNEPKIIQRKLEKAGLKVITESLKPYSDYILGELAIERKESKDFYSSVYSNRLFKQMNNLCSLDDYRPVLALHGSFPPLFKWVRTKSGVRNIKLSKEEYQKKYATTISVLSTLYNYENLSVLMLNDEDMFVDWLIDRYYRQTKESVKPITRKKATNPKEVKWNIYTMIPGVGSKTASSMMDVDVSISDIAQMSAEELRETFGCLSEKKAELLHQVLHLKKLD